ncbi:MAG: hypothetical protein WKG01_14305 [Kofleriaceae bacterium]
MKPASRLITTLGWTCLALSACATDEVEPTLEATEASAEGTPDDAAVSGWYGSSVYVIDNVPSRNAVRRFRRRADGGLISAGTFPTGGLGSGDGLGSQGAVILDDKARMLYVVNAGSDEISAFEVHPFHLVLRDIVRSGGARPISLTVHDDLLYVVNAGRDGIAGNIAGFRLVNRELVPIASSIRPLSAAAAGPAQVQFDPAGTTLVVTEKATNNLTTYRINGQGAAGAPIVTPSHGQTPFGFSFDHRGTLIVSEAFGGAPNASAVSSYRLTAGVPVLVSGSVPTEQTAACWIAIRGTRYAFATNTASGSVSGYAIDDDGTIERFSDGGVTAQVGGAPTDLDFTHDGRVLYVLDSSGDAIDILRARADGSLETGGRLTGLPATSVGIAAE